MFWLRTLKEARRARKLATADAQTTCNTTNAQKSFKRRHTRNKNNILSLFSLSCSTFHCLCLFLCLFTELLLWNFLQVELFSTVCSAKPSFCSSLWLLLHFVFISFEYKFVRVTCFHVNFIDLLLVHEWILLLVKGHEAWKENSLSFCFFSFWTGDIKAFVSTVASLHTFVNYKHDVDVVNQLELHKCQLDISDRCFVCFVTREIIVLSKVRFI